MAYKSVLKKILAVALALLVWQLGAMALDSSLLLVSPVETARELFVQVRDPAFWGTGGFSLQRILLGFGAAFLTASVMAGLSFRFPVVETLLWPYITVAKSTPVASIIILCLIWLSSRSLSVFISFLMALPVLYANILQGLKVYDPGLLEVTQVYRVSPVRRFVFVTLPQLKPYLLTACHTALGLSWKSGIAAEVIGIPDGSIGERLYQAKVYLATRELFAWTVVIIILSVLVEKLFIGLLKLVYGRLERL